MRVGIVTETWHPHMDGVITRLSETVRVLRREGHEVLVIAPAGGEPSFEGAESGAFPASVCGSSTAAGTGGVRYRAWGATSTSSARTWSTSSTRSCSVSRGVLAARRRRLPLVCSYHTDVVGYAGYYHLGWLAGVIRRLTRTLHNAAAVNLATSSAACHRLRSLGVRNVHLWQRGVDLELFRPRRHETTSRAAPGADQNQVLVLNVGRISEEKELRRLRPLARHPDSMLALVGEGPARDHLRRQFAGMQASFPGRLGRADLANTPRARAGSTRAGPASFGGNRRPGESHPFAVRLPGVGHRKARSSGRVSVPGRW